MVGGDPGVGTARTGDVNSTGAPRSGEAKARPRSGEGPDRLRDADQLVAKLSTLEAVSRTLDPPPVERERIRAGVVAYGEEFLNAIYQLPAFRDGTPPGEFPDTIEESPADLGRLLDLIRAQIDGPGLNPASGGHLGYIPGGGIYYSALGDYLADISNRFAGLHFTAPGAVRLENMLLKWMMGIVGYPAAAEGNLASSGSVANLIAVVTARDASGLEPAEYNKAVIYRTTQTHHSVDKAIRIAGLAGAAERMVPMDDRHRMQPEALEALIRADLKAGLVPLMIVAAAGTTDAGAVDPLDEIGEIASRHRVWYHVDAAYGGFFALCDEGRRILRGMDRSDSIVLDPHKGLFLPYGTGGVLVKNGRALMDAFHYRPSYLQDALRDGVVSPSDTSPELTKHFRGLRLWLPLRLHGLAPFRAAIEEKLLLARYFHTRISETEGFEVGPPPDLSVVTFRCLPKSGDPDEFNRRLVAAIHADGRVFLSSTVIGGKFMLRLAILAFRTHRDTIDLALDVLKTCAGRVTGT
jgi:glutamate/tyrosine decarboxylase-like PLP-dependent enzyme